MRAVRVARRGKKKSGFKTLKKILYCSAERRKKKVLKILTH